MPPGDKAGAAAFAFCVHTPGLAGWSQDCPNGQNGSAQQVSSTQFPETQSVGSSHAPPSGISVGVDVAVRVLVDVGVDVAVGVDVTVCVTVAVAVAVGVCVTVGVNVAVAVSVTVEVAVAVAVAVAVWVTVEVNVAVAVSVAVEVAVGVAVGVDCALQNPSVGFCWVQNVSPGLQLSATPPEQSTSSVHRMNDVFWMLQKFAQPEQSAGGDPKAPHPPALIESTHTQQIAPAGGAETAVDNRIARAM